MKLAAGLLLALASTAALSSGFYVQHTASGQLPALSVRHPLASLAVLFTDRRWLAGFVTGLGGWGLYIAALGLAPISLVQATSAGGVGLIALLVRAGGVRLSRREWVAVIVSVCGLLLLGLSLAGGTGHAAAPSWRQPAAWAAISAMVAAIAAFPAARVLQAGAGLAVAGGLMYSAGDVATKAAVDGVSPVYVFVVMLAACHGLGFVCVQLSFQRGTALATAGVSTLLTNLLPILAGVIIFSEYVPHGAYGVLRELGFAGAVVGAALLGRLVRRLQLGDGGEGLAGGGDVVDAEDAGAEPGADGQGGGRALGALVDRQVQGLADEVLVRHGGQHRPAGAGQLAQTPGDLERLPRVLAEVVGGIHEDRGRADPCHHGPFGIIRDVGGQLAHDIAVRGPVRAGAGRQAAGV
jgi:hypothetical protein